jgi:hypothetical protein
LALIDSSAYVDTDDDALAAARNAISSGLFTPAEAKRHWNLTDAEAAEISKPRARSRQPTELQRIDAEIAKLDALRKSDRKTYWGDHVQDLLAKLYSRRELVEAGVPGEMPADVVDEWRRSGGVEHRFGIARAAAVKAMEALDEDEQAELQASFDSALPASARSTIYKFMAVEPGGWRSARPDEFHAFQSTEEGGELCREWGPNAARNVGIIRGRVSMMSDAASSEEDRRAGFAWLEGLPTNQYKAVLNALLP